MPRGAKQKQERSSREDWLREALELLGEMGISSITIDALCNRLGLTKGSFYWHFSGRQELLSAMVERYASTHPLEIRERLEQSGLDDWGQLQQLSQEAYEKYARIDHAMRIWAEDSEETLEAVKQSDAKTLRFHEQKLKAMGVPLKKARPIARLILCASLGYSFARPSLGGKKEYDEMGPLIKSLIDLEIQAKN
ncbi:TetR/AcrR family transcriptional regulator [Halioglobus maricola]|nr:TetR/AcrR family transcriptional regulator [Halioglobus maricola]